MSLAIRRAGGGGAGEGEKALALLLLVLRDLADGWLALGFGGTRGRGTVSVSEVRFTGNGLPSPWASLAGRTLADLIDDPPEPVTQAFASWQERTGLAGTAARTLAGTVRESGDGWSTLGSARYAPCQVPVAAGKGKEIWADMAEYAVSDEHGNISVIDTLLIALRPRAAAKHRRA